MNILGLIRWAFSLTQLRGSPADAPQSLSLLVQLLILDLMLSIIYLEAVGREFTAFALGGRLGLQLLMTYAVLRLFGYGGRFVQTNIALYASSALITLFVLPVAAGLVRSPADSVDWGVQFLLLGYIGLLGWSVVINGHVLRHALGIKFWYGVGLALGIFILYDEMATRLFPLP